MTTALRHCLNTIPALMATCLLVTGAMGEEDQERFQRIAIVGASATAGYGVNIITEYEEGARDERGIDLADIFMASHDEKDLVFMDLGSSFFFTRPISYAQTSVQRAEQWNADIVLGIDFLFWCLYGTDDGKGGRLKDESQRLEKLEMGLKALEELDIPVVIGNIPDMTRIGGYMLSQSQRPKIETLKKANERVMEWANEHPNIVITDLHDFIRKIHAKESFRIGEHTWDLENEEIAIIGDDQLHPTLDGLIALAQALDQAARTNETMKSRMPEFQLERDKVHARLRTRSSRVVNPRRRRPTNHSFESSARSRSRSDSPSARSMARAIASRR